MFRHSTKYESGVSAEDVSQPAASTFASHRASLSRITLIASSIIIISIAKDLCSVSTESIQHCSSFFGGKNKTTLCTIEHRICEQGNYFTALDCNGKPLGFPCRNYTCLDQISMPKDFVKGSVLSNDTTRCLFSCDQQEPAVRFDRLAFGHGLGDASHG